MIEQAGGGPSASIIEVGDGESTLVDDLLALGLLPLTVLDISQAAIAETKNRLGDEAECVRWVDRLETAKSCHEGVDLTGR